MKPKYILFIAFMWGLLLNIFPTYSQQVINKLFIPGTDVNAGKKVNVPVNLTNDSEIVALQFKLQIPEEALLPVSEVVLTERKSDQTITVKHLGSNNYQFVVFSLTNSPLKGNSGTVINIPIQIPSYWAENSTHSFSMSEVVLSTKTGNDVLSSFETGNLKVLVEPRPDIAALNVTVTNNSYTPSDRISLSYIVKNEGDKITGAGWSEQLSLVADNGESYFLGTVYYDQLLAAGASVSRQVEYTLPEILGVSGNVKIKVKLVPDAGLGELASAQTNNTMLSASGITIGKKLKLELPQATIHENNASPVRCTLYRSGSRVSAETFSLSADDATRLNVPASVTIPAGQSGVTFYINAIDNAVLNVNPAIIITAKGNGYPDVAGNISIEDDEIPSLTIKASKTELNEGDIFTLTIERELITNDPLTVYLTSDHSKRFELPAKIDIPAGQKSVVVNVTTINDNLPDVTIDAIFTATASNHITAKTTVTLLDDDLPEISLTIAPETVSESAGPMAVMAVLKRLTKTDSNITIKLSDNSNGKLYYSSQTLTLAPGVQEARFTVGVIDNALVDGDQEIDITAAVYISSCSCSASGTSAGIVHARLTVLDDDGPALKITSSQTMLLEGKTDAAVLTISRNTATAQALTVTLSSDHDSELTYNKTVTIPAGQTSVDVPVSVKSNDITEGDRTVTFTATSTGYTKGVCWVMITDQTLPDAVIFDFRLSASQVEAAGKLDINITISNQGAAVLPSQTKVNVYLSNSTAKLITLYTQKALAVGESETLTKNITLPDITGSYTISAIVNEERAVKELLDINNNSEKIAIQLLPKYTITVTTDKKIYKPGEAVIINGTASGNGIANAPVDVYIINSGIRQVINATTGSDGKFQTTFQPQTYQSGHFAVGACYPNEGLSTEQATFDIYGLKRTASDYIKCETLTDELYNGTIQLSNPGTLKLTNISTTIVSKPANCDVSFEPVAEIAADGTIDLKYTITGHAPTEGSDWEQIKAHVTTTEGAMLDLTIYYYCRSPKGQLTASIPFINTTMTKSASRDYPFTITNTGKGETGKITLSLPNTSWMTLATPKEMASLKNGESATVILRLTPTNDMALNVPVTGNIGINCENGQGMSLNFSVEPVSESKGTLVIDVCDEYTYYTAEAPHLAGAKVVVKHPVTGAVVAQGTTGVNGIFSVELPEGYYGIEVSAEKHDRYQNNILVDPGKETKKVVNLSFQAITYSWEVVETEVEDKYEVKTTVSYETNVPVPVVEVIFPEKLEYEDQVFSIVATNKGLIAANNVTIALPQIDEISFELLSQNPIESLAPQQSTIFYVKMTINEQSELKAAGPHHIIGCIAGAIGLYYTWYCGLEDKLGTAMANYTWGECSSIFPYISGGSGSGGDTGPGGPGGGTCWQCIVDASYNSNLPVIERNCNDCEDKFRNKIIDCGLGLIPKFGCAWGLGRCASGWTFKTNKEKIWCPATSIGGCLPTNGGSVGSCLVGFLDPCDRLLKSTNETVGYPSYISSFQERLKFAYEEYLEILNLTNYYFGDEAWLTCNENELNNFYVSFLSLNPLENSISYEDLIKIKPINIEEDKLISFIERWNNTRMILNGEMVNNENYVNLDRVNDYMNEIQLYEDKAKEYGYDSMSDLLNNEFEKIQKQINEHSNSVCSSISLQFSQSMTMTRQAFRGTLTVFNGHENIPMNNVKLNLVVKDENGNQTTPHEFQINNESLDKFSGDLDGAWTLNAQETGKATILFIPTKYAALNEPKNYSFGGTLSYLDPFTGLEVTRDLYPVTLTVKPSPDLDLTYFMQRDVLADDPLTTDVVEPMVPSEFSLLIHNVGAGEGSNIRMVTNQPEIVANEKGLLVNFELLSSQLNGADHTLALGGNVATEFGNIPARGAAYAQWWFTSTLQGHFTDYDVKATHVTSYGNPDLTLLNEVTIHELIRSIRIPAANNSFLTGFMANDIPDADDLPDMLYLSDGTTENVYITPNAQFVSNGNNQYTFTINPVQTGWNYGIVNDPTNGHQKLLSIKRLSDNTIIDLRNFWQTYCTLRDGKDPLYENKLHFADKFGTTSEQYLLTFEEKPAVTLAVESFTGIPQEGTVASIPVSEIVVRFNKPIDMSTFAAEDITLNCQGMKQDASLISITKLNDQEFKLNIAPIAQNDGYYVLTIQTSGITDNENFKGEVGKSANWIQYLDGKVQFTLNVTPENSGTVTPGSAKYGYKSVLNLLATPKPGYDFVSWNMNGNTLSSNATYSYTLQSPSSITALFKIKSYNVTVNYNQSGGAISGGATGIYEYGKVFNLTAIPVLGYVFTGWKVNGVLTETNPSLQFTLSDNIIIEALFIATETRTYNLQTGWNWISVSVKDPNLNNPVDLFNPILSNLITVKGQDKELSNEGESGLQGNLVSIEPAKSYKINMLQPATWQLKALPFMTDEATINLVSGWNWIGYLPSKEMSLKDALADLAAEENDVIKSQDRFSMFDGENWIGSLKKLSPNSGYMYYANQTKSFIYNSTISQTPENHNFSGIWNYDARKYPDNMNIVAKLYNGSDLVDSDVYSVGAFVGEECRGVGLATSGYLFITVHGEVKDETVKFKVKNSSTNDILSIKETVKFSSIINGTLDNPINMHLGEITGIDNIKINNIIGLYPNPVKNTATIKYVIDTNVTSLVLSVHDMLGKVVDRIEITSFAAGENEIVWQRGNLPAGSYFCTLEGFAQNKIIFKTVKKLLLE